MSARQLVRLWPYFSEPGRKGRDWLVGRLAPWYALRAQVQFSAQQKVAPGTVLPVALPHDERGWRLPEDLTPPKVAGYWGIACNLFTRSLHEFQLARGPSRALRDLLEVCRRERIPVVLVVMPESTTFRSWYSPEGQAGPRRLLAKLRERYGVEVIDATEWMPDGEFLDGHHLLPRGARAFTDRLGEELRRRQPSSRCLLAP
jgi:hypothetical protein